MADEAILLAEYTRNRGQYTVGKMAESQMKWVEHMVRMKDDRWSKSSETKKEVAENKEDYS